MSYDDVDDSSTDSSDDENSSLHSASNGPIGGGNPAWMAKFSRPSQFPPPTSVDKASRSSSFSETDDEEPGWMSKFAVNKSPDGADSRSSHATTRRGGVSPRSTVGGDQGGSSSPEWMQTIQKSGIKEPTIIAANGGQTDHSWSSSHHRRSLSPGRSLPVALSTTPSTPSWVKQYRTTGASQMAGAPSLPPLVPSSRNVNPTGATTPAWKKASFNTSNSTIASEVSPSACATGPKGPEPPKRMTRVDSHVDTKTGAATSEPPGLPSAPLTGHDFDDDEDDETDDDQSAPSVRLSQNPDWMNRFGKIKTSGSEPSNGSGGHGNPGDGDETDDDHSVSSVRSSQNLDWMNRFGKIKTSTGPKPPNGSGRHCNPVDDDETDDDQSVASVRSSQNPDWMNRFGKIKPSTGPKAQNGSGGYAIPVGGPTHPKAISSSSPDEEPEWMKRFREIGMKDEEPSPATIPEASQRIPRTVVKAKGRARPSATTSGERFSPGANLRSGTHSPQRGMVSAPSSPRSFRATIENSSYYSGGVGGNMACTGHAAKGMISAPSSPTTSVGHPKSPLPVAMVVSPASYGSPQQRRQSIGSELPGPTILSGSPVSPKVYHPAAQAPQKPEWMNKVMAVSQAKEKPTWMKKLILKKKGLPSDEKRSVTTPPWKKRDRLREEQAKKLSEALGIDIDGDGNDDNDYDDLSNVESWASDYQSEDDEANVPEWVRQYRKMNMKEARVISAQGKAPQKVTSLRKGSLKMINRTGDIVDKDDVIRPITVRSHSSRSLSLSRHRSITKKKRDPTKGSDHTRNGAQDLNQSQSTQLSVSEFVSQGDLRRIDREGNDWTEVGAEQGRKELDGLENFDSNGFSNEANNTGFGDSFCVTGEGEDKFCEGFLNTRGDTGIPKRPERKPSDVFSLCSSIESEETNNALRRSSLENKAVPNSELAHNSLHSTASAAAYINQVTIDSSAPDNVMGMWGKTLNAKKPGNTTLMSHRMILHQQEKVKERIDKAKKGAVNSDVQEDANGSSALGENEITLSLEESASILFFGGAKDTESKPNVFGIDNAGENTYGFGGNNSTKQSVKGSSTDSKSLDNSAAAHDMGSAQTLSAVGTRGKFLEEAVDEAAFSSDFRTELPSFSRNDNEQSVVPCDPSEAPDKEAKGASEKDEEANSSAKKNESGSHGIQQTQKTSLDESDSESESEHEKQKPKKQLPTLKSQAPADPKVPGMKKSRLDDSDSEDDSTGPKSSKKPVRSETKATPVVPSSSTQSVTTPIKPLVRKKSWLDDSDSDDSITDTPVARKKETFRANPDPIVAVKVEGKAKKGVNAEEAKDSPNKKLATEASQDFQFGGDYFNQSDGSKISKKSGAIDLAARVDDDCMRDDANNLFPLDVKEPVGTDSVLDTAMDDAVANGFPVEMSDDQRQHVEWGTPSKALATHESESKLKSEKNEWEAAMMGLANDMEEDKQIEFGLGTFDATLFETGSTVKKATKKSDKESSTKKEGTKEKSDQKKSTNIKDKKSSEKTPSKKEDTKVKKIALDSNKVKSKKISKSSKAVESKKDKLDEKKDKQLDPKKADIPAAKIGESKPKMVDLKIGDAKKQGKEDKSKASDKKKDREEKTNDADKKKKDKEKKKDGESSKTKDRHGDDSKKDKEISSKSSKGKDSKRELKNGSKEVTSMFPKSPFTPSNGKKTGKLRSLVVKPSKIPNLDTAKPKSKGRMEIVKPASPTKVGLVKKLDIAKPKSKGRMEIVNPASPKRVELVKNVDSAKPKSKSRMEIVTPKSPIKMGLAKKLDIAKPKSKGRMETVKLTSPIKPTSKAMLVPAPKSTPVQSKKKLAPLEDSFSDDDSFMMADFDDNFSVSPDFGDFAEDGSVVPIKAHRHPPSVTKSSNKSKDPVDKKGNKKEKKKVKSKTATSDSTGKANLIKEKKSDKKEGSKKKKKEQ